MFIHLDPRRPDVLVPRGFMGQPQLVLQVGLNMAIPIPDLRIEDFGISCTLSFNRSPFWCRIPWSAVYALVGEDGRGGVWADDVPPEIQQQKPGSAPPKAAAGKRARPKLTVAGAEGRPEPEPASAAPRRALAAVPASVAMGETPQSPARPVALGETSKPRPVRDLASVRSQPADDGIVEDEPPPREAPSSPSSPSSPTEPSSPSSDDQAGSPGQGSGAKKPKREIPPYLRRIK